ncbi:hypothetical protein ACQFX9_29945 [Aliinostoc sp. HNIBRCY26]
MMAEFAVNCCTIPRKQAIALKKSPPLLIALSHSKKTYSVCSDRTW